PESVGQRVSRDGRPSGSQPACAAGDVARGGTTRIPAITTGLSLAPESCTRCVVRLPCDVPSEGRPSERNGLTTFRRCNRRGEVGGVSSPVARHLRARRSEPHNQATYHFGPSLSASWACSQ